MSKYETHEYDVVVVGTGGAALRAAIGASARGARTALVCKSLLGKAHTVMADGGISAHQSYATTGIAPFGALQRGNDRDSWGLRPRLRSVAAARLDSWHDGAWMDPTSFATDYVGTIAKAPTAACTRIRDCVL